MLKQLLLDIGNTRIKWILMEGENMLAGGQWIHGAESGLSLIQIAPNEAPGQIVVSNVAGSDIKQQVIDWAHKTYSLPVHFVVASSEDYGIKNAYDVPEDLGSDRWLTLIASHSLYQSNSCVIDAGSAITIDLLTANGQHLGGYILPGFTSLKKALSRDTSLNQEGAGLSRSAERQPGKSTRNCIDNGALVAICNTIEDVVDNFEKQMHEKIQCIVTGGDGTRLSDKLHHPHLLEPALVLKGMAIVGNRLAQTL